MFFAMWAVSQLFVGAAPRAEGQPSEQRSEVERSSVYEIDVLPLLRRKCIRCHGDEARKADLNLQNRDGVLKGGESGPVVIAGDPDSSLLFERIHSGEMPPEEQDRLDVPEIALIRKWIMDGASFETGRTVVGNSAATPNQHDVIPILLRRCAACHGRHQQLADLDLRSTKAMLAGGKSGPAIIPGRPDESLLIRKIQAGQMPPLDRLVEVSVKPIEPAEVDTLVRWIAAGAPQLRIEPDVATTEMDPLVSDADRSFWAFRAPQPVEVPSVRNSQRVRNEVDAFVLSKLESVDLSFAEDADRLTLIRRAAFDLTGLPPEPEEVQAFLEDQHPEAWELLIDRLLASPRYGERWGRYWLDLAGYADSEGKREQDLFRPHAWRYRDYVIRSFNSDKPYDRFLLEQLAGDELVDYQQAAEITPEICDNLVATGFLRMTPDASWANITGYLDDRVEVIADEIDVLGSAVMGLTLKCARCHSHKFDPIPHRDYYRLMDIFKGAYDEYAWVKPDVRPGIGPVSQDVIEGRHLPYVTSVERRAWEAHEAAIDMQIRDARARSESEDVVRTLQSQRLPEPRIQALWDRGQPSPTYIYRRGDPLNPGRLVGPGVPSVLTDGRTPFVVTPPWPGASQTGRRLAFARWLTKPDHPLTARVIVNHVWRHHFGAGIVRTPGNFGKAGSPPTHPELLDRLALRFISEGWSIKSLHRLLMSSTTYRQSSIVTAEMRRKDPDNSFCSRMPLTRLDAEALYDSLLLVAGRLDETPFGPADGVTSRPDGLITPVGTARGWRRMIYVQQLRKKLATHLENFDFPQMNPNCLERSNSMVAPQALHLLNNGMIFELSEHFARRVVQEVGPDPSRQIDRVYRIALSRPPDAEAMQVGLEAMEQFATEWSRQQTGQPRDSEELQIRTLTACCHAIVNSAAFLFVD